MCWCFVKIDVLRCREPTTSIVNSEGGFDGDSTPSNLVVSDGRGFGD